MSGFFGSNSLSLSAIRTANNASGTGLAVVSLTLGLLLALGGESGERGCFVRAWNSVKRREKSAARGCRKPHCCTHDAILNIIHLFDHLLRALYTSSQVPKDKREFVLVINPCGVTGRGLSLEAFIITDTRQLSCSHTFEARSS